MTPTASVCDTVLECPFCKKAGVKAYHKPSYLEHSTSRIAAGSKTKYYRVPESYEVMGGCPHCGKSRREVREAFDTGVTKPLSHSERVARLRKSGLPTVIVSSRREG